METNKNTEIIVSNNTMFWKSGFKKPIGRFWKRYFNKKVRNLYIE